MDNWQNTLLTQYVNSLELVKILEGFNTAIDPDVAIAEFYDKVFNPATAVGWGLDAWGHIVDIPRIIKAIEEPESFGFDGSFLYPFNQAPFYSALATNYYTLTDEAYRLLIFFKAAVNITNGSLADINRLIAAAFPDRGNIMAIHTGTMAMRVVVRFPMKPYELAIMQNEETLPIPVGVMLEWYYVPEPTFGFDGSGLHPFNQGNFAPGDPQNVY